MAGFNTDTLVLNYKGVKVYHGWKNRRPLTFWYALTPGHDAEEDGQDFDVRALPEKYTQGLLVEDDCNPTSWRPIRWRSNAPLTMVMTFWRLDTRRALSHY
jgi:hypothetical protein